MPSTKKPRQPSRRASRAAALRRDAEATASARSRRPDSAQEERQSEALRKAIEAAFGRA